MASQPGTFGMVPQKISIKPKRYHGYAVLLFVMGTLFPPLGSLAPYVLRVLIVDILLCNKAVAARFGIGKDFWINLLLTICGYIPGTSAAPSDRLMFSLIFASRPRS